MENYELEVMDARKWIEFGKMYNNMIAAGWEIVLESLIIDDLSKYGMNGFDLENEIYYGSNQKDFLNSPYLAIKDFYFKHFLGQNVVDFEYDIPQEQEEALYLESDKQGITIDELVANILKEHIEDSEDADECSLIEKKVELQEANCCNLCDYISFRKDINSYFCTKLKIPTKRNKICSEFEW